MANRTDQEQPPPSPTGVFASRIITLAAGHLSQHPHQTHPMTDDLLDDAIRSAQDTVLNEVRPRSSHDLVRAAVRTTLLPVSGTVGEYADRLHEMAVTG